MSDVVKTIILSIFYLTEKLFLFLFRINIGLFLRFEVGLSEVEGVVYFHSFQAAIYLTAFIMGQIAIFSFKPLFLLSPLTYISAFALMAIAILTADGSNSKSSVIDLESFTYESHTTFIISGLVFLGVTHGLNLVSHLKNVEWHLSDAAVHNMIMLNFSLEIFSSFIFSFIFYAVDEKTAIYYMTIMLVIFVGLLVLLQLIMLVMFFSNPRKYPQHGAFSHIGCHIYAISIPIKSFFNDAELEKLKKEKLAKLDGVVKAKIAKDEPITVNEMKQKLHWADFISPPYSQEFVNDLKLMDNYWAILVTFSFIFVAFEIRYSYWMFMAYRLNRKLLTVFPTQTVFTIQQIVLLCFTVLYVYYIGPALRRFWFHAPLRRMGIGIVFVIMATMSALLICYQIDELEIRPEEPYFSQTKIAIRNGLNCEVSFNERVTMSNQQWKNDNGSYALIKTKPKASDTSRALKLYRAKLDQNDRLYDKLPSKMKDKTDYMFPAYRSRIGDSSVLYVAVPERGSDLRGLQTVTVTPLNCSSEIPFNIPFQRPVDDLRRTNNMTIYIIEPAKVTPYIVPFTRPRSTEPHIRFFFANQTPVYKFQVWREEERLYDFPMLNNYRAEYCRFHNGDGYNLRFIVDNETFTLEYTLYRGGLFDMVFVDQGGKISSYKLYIFEAPHDIGFYFAFFPYTFIAIGELLFGVMGLRFIMTQTPLKFRFHTQLDWHLMHALANLYIITIVSCGLFMSFFWQLAAISGLVLIGSFLFMVFAFQYNYMYASDMKDEQKFDRVVNLRPRVKK